MKFQLTTLVENGVYGRKLQAEHGLSIYIETPSGKVLFDTGASDLFIRNARLLHIDLQEVDYLILSHGHSDHTGGLRYFLQFNGHAAVVCKRGVLAPKFKDDRENGMKHTDALDLARFRFIEEQTELLPGVVLFPQLPIVNPADTHFDHFFVQLPGGRMADTFEDELAVALVGEEGMAVISACSHRGITNMLRTVCCAYPHRQLRLLMGGFHIHGAGEEKYRPIVSYLQEHLPEQIGVCHCTGVDQYASFCRDLGSRVFYNHTGHVMQVDL